MAQVSFLCLSPSFFPLSFWRLDHLTLRLVSCHFPFSELKRQLLFFFFVCRPLREFLSLFIYLFWWCITPVGPFFLSFHVPKKKKRKGTHICRFISVKARRLFLLSVINVFCSLSLSLSSVPSNDAALPSPLFFFFIFSVGRKYDCYECSATSPWVEKERIWSACIRFFFT